MSEIQHELGPGTKELLTKCHIPLDKVGKAGEPEQIPAPEFETTDQQPILDDANWFSETNIKPKSMALHVFILVVGVCVLLSPLFAEAISSIHWSSHRHSSFDNLAYHEVDFESHDREEPDEDEIEEEDTIAVPEEDDEDEMDEDEMEQVAATPAPPAPAPAPAMNRLDQMVDDAVLNYQYVTKDDLRGFSSKELRILRNSIYAHHNRKFKSADLQEYFSKFSWYSADYDDVESELSDIERHNVRFIQGRE